MAEYAITFAKSARREPESLEMPVVARVFTRIEDLARNPRPRGVPETRGRQGLWRLRVGDYRVIYMIDDDRGLVDIVAVRHRKDAYR